MKLFNDCFRSSMLVSLSLGCTLNLLPILTVLAQAPPENDRSQAIDRLQLQITEVQQKSQFAMLELQRKSEQQLENLQAQLDRLQSGVEPAGMLAQDQHSGQTRQAGDVAVEWLDRIGVSGDF